MNNRHFVCTMMINGEKMPAFSGTTLRLPTAGQDYLNEIIANTRANYARPKAEVEAEIATAITPPIQLQSRTARDKAKKAAREAGMSSISGNTISPSGVAGPQKLGNLMAQIQQIRAAAEAGDPNSMKIEGVRPKVAPSPVEQAQLKAQPAAAAPTVNHTNLPNTASDVDASNVELPPLPTMEGSSQPIPPLAQILSQPVQPVEPEGLIIHHDKPQSATTMDTADNHRAASSAQASDGNNTTPNTKRRRRRYKKKSAKPAAE